MKLLQVLPFLFSFIISTTIFPQISNPRYPAEYEEVSGILMEADLQIAFPTLWDECIDPFIKAAEACINENVHLYVIDPDTGGSFTTRFVNMDTVFSNRGLVSPFIHIIHVNNTFDTFPWARDNGPFTIYENSVGEIYYAGYDGDSTAAYFSQYIGGNFIKLPKVSNDILYYDGGNWLTDGHGTFNICNTTSSTFTNGLMQPPITPFGEYLGIQKTLNVTGVDVHVDYWLKLINEETFVIGYLPPSNYDDDPRGYYDYQAYIDSGVADIKRNLVSAFGRDFKFYPIQNAPSFDDVHINTTYFSEVASYTNSLIINKTVLVPQYTSLPYDTVALNIYRSIMPGYNVVGVNCRQYAVGAGGLHCITREIYADNPIYIKHAWLPDSLNQTNDYQIDAAVTSNGGIASVSLFWTTDINNEFKEIMMTQIDDDNYRGFIPGQAYGTNIYYYLSATNNNGKTISKPIVAPEGYFKTLIDPGNVNDIPETAEKDTREDYSLDQNYPNPFNSSTIIKYQISSPCLVTIKIYDILGNEITTLVNEKKDKGNYVVNYNANNLASGIYFYRMLAGNMVSTKKLILMK
jgi:agmatine deiminase